MDKDEEIKKRRMDLVTHFTSEKYKTLPIISSITVALLAVSFSGIREIVEDLAMFKIAFILLIAIIPISLFLFLKSFRFEEEDMIEKYEKILSGDNNSISKSVGYWKRIVINSPKIMLSIFILAVILLITSFFVNIFEIICARDASLW